MTFGEALEQAKQGKKIARKGWNGKGMYIMFEKEYTFNGDVARRGLTKELGKTQDKITIEPRLDFKTAQNTVSVGWRPTSMDMFADDWVVLNER